MMGWFQVIIGDFQFGQRKNKIPIIFSENSVFLITIFFLGKTTKYKKNNNKFIYLFLKKSFQWSDEDEKQTCKQNEGGTRTMLASRRAARQH